MWIDPVRRERFLSDDIHLVRGSGKGVNGDFDACAMQAADWLAGGLGKTDKPDCVDVTIARFCIDLNDTHRFSEWRDELKPYVLRAIGTKTDDAARDKRMFMCANWAVREIAPLTFDAIAEFRPKHEDLGFEWAAKLRAVPPIIDKESALAGREVAYAAASAAYSPYSASAASAASAAYAAADAAYAVYAACAVDAACAVVDAACAADAACGAYAAYAASAREKAAAFTRRMWDESLALLDRLIKVTEKPTVI